VKRARRAQQHCAIRTRWRTVGHRLGPGSIIYPAAAVAECAILICVERGRLESEALLLLESLRRWGGALAGAPVYAFAPRADSRPAPDTVEALEALEASYVDEPLVHRFAELPTYNKVAVSAWAERELEHETLVFADTDSVFLGEPSELIGGDWVAAMRPVDRRIAGSKGKGKGEPLWRKMYDELGVHNEPYVRTGVGGMRIRAYWNSGLIAARRSAGLFAAWEDALARLHDADIVPGRWPHFMDQLSWAGVTADVHDRVKVLPPTYNYALRQRLALMDGADSLDLPDLVHLHYRLWFHLPESLPKVVPPFDPASDRYRWLDERLPLEPTVEELD
jgi:hypothetical protein